MGDSLHILILTHSKEQFLTWASLPREEESEYFVHQFVHRDEVVSLLKEHSFHVVVADYPLHGWSIEGLLKLLNHRLPLILAAPPLLQKETLQLIRQGVVDVVQQGDNHALQESIPRTLQHWQENSRQKEEYCQLYQDGQLLNLLLKSSPDAIFVKDLQGRYKIVNDSAGRLTGIPPENHLGKDDFQIFPPEIANHLRGYDETILAAGTSQSFEETLPFRDGQPVTLWVTKGPLKDTEGNIVGLFGVARDITLLKKAQKEAHEHLEELVAQRTRELQQREHDLQTILDSVPSTIGYWDRNLCMRFGNKAYQEWFGIDPEKMVGAHIKEILGQELYAKNLPYILAALRGEAQIFERTMRGNNGEIYHRLIHYLPDFQDGQVAGFYAMVLDITAIKKAELIMRESEARFRKLFEEAPVGILVYRADGQCILANESVATTVGGSTLQLMQQNFYHLDSWKKSPLLQTATEALQSGESRRCNTQLVSTFGREVELECAFVPLELDNQTHLVMMVNEITHLRKTERQLKEAKEAAEAANRAKSDFLANMSHEIRTPMNTIMGMGHLVQQTDLNDTQREYIDKINRSTNSLLRILNDILDFSKIDSGKLELEKAPFDLYGQLEQIVDILQPKLAIKKEVEFIFDIPITIPHILIGDSTRLRQVLTNLCDNALKFTELGEITLAISFEKQQEQQGIFHFSVEDTGIGIAPEHLAKIFLPFQQADTSTTRRYGGSGLGLSICHQLVAIMGGKIQLESEQGCGSRFSFSLPFEVSGQQPPSSQLPDFSHLQKTLLVSNHGTLRKVLQKRLQELHLPSSEASSGEKASELFLQANRNNHPYQLVILDWQLASENSLLIARQLRSMATSQPPVILFMTPAYEHTTCQEELRKADFPERLPKPVLGVSLSQALLAAMGKQKVTIDSHCQPVVPAKTTSLQGLHILLVDDYQDNQELIQEILHRRGVTLTLASTGLQAVREVEAAPHPFDLILMDVQMPIMDGFQATRQIRQHWDLHQLPIIAMTASAMVQDVENCLACGMNDHIAKPIHVQELINKIILWAKSGEKSSPVPAHKAETHDWLALCDQLATALNNRDMQSDHLFAELKKTFETNSLFQATIERLERLIHELDVQNALVELDAMKRNFNTKATDNHGQS
ncbi:MAG: PAS domain S-box protein [Magnetococcales bacterium]|nr:PAS domain S-box protein [Magnetococcales bacterium]NGZ27273.1 PAS domain S-box protein [Magnetococcales bacterium]